MTAMQWINLGFSLLFLIWMFLIAWLLWKIIQQNVEHFQKLEQVLIDSVVSATQSTQQSIETTKRAMKLLEDRLASP
jgi:cytoskeletal protein RodZ